MTSGTKSVVVSPKSDLVKAMRKIISKGFVMLRAECDAELPDARSCYCAKCEAELYK